MYCKYCGKQVSDDSEFCSYCGKNIAVKAESDEIIKETSRCEGQEKLNDDNIIVEERECIKTVADGFYDEELERQVFNNARSKRHITYIMILAIVLIGFAIIGRSIWIEECNRFDCNSKSIIGKKYCHSHLCEEKGCSEYKSEDDAFCYKHLIEKQCAMSTCTNNRTSGGNYCENHTCQSKGCLKGKLSRSNYCGVHQSAEDENPFKIVFRDVVLGMSLEEVEQAENKSGAVYNETYIVMDAEVYGQVGNVVYAFNREMSSLGDITFMLHDGDYEAFKKVLSILSNEYGNPDSNEDKRTEKNFPRHRVRWYTEKEAITLLYMNDETSILIDSKD